MGSSIYPSPRAFGATGAAKQPQPAAADPAEPQTRQVQGRLFEVLPGYGLAHFEADDGCVYGVMRTTPGIVSADAARGATGVLHGHGAAGARAGRRRCIAGSWLDAARARGETFPL